MSRATFLVIVNAQNRRAVRVHAYSLTARGNLADSPRILREFFGKLYLSFGSHSPGFRLALAPVVALSFFRFFRVWFFAGFGYFVHLRRRKHATDTTPVGRFSLVSGEKENE